MIKKNNKKTDKYAQAICKYIFKNRRCTYKQLKRDLKFDKATIFIRLYGNPENKYTYWHEGLIKRGHIIAHDIRKARKIIYEDVFEFNPQYKDLYDLSELFQEIKFKQEIQLNVFGEYGYIYDEYIKKLKLYMSIGNSDKKLYFSSKKQGIGASLLHLFIKELFILNPDLFHIQKTPEDLKIKLKIEVDLSEVFEKIKNVREMCKKIGEIYGFECKNEYTEYKKPDIEYYKDAMFFELEERKS